MTTTAELPPQTQLYQLGTGHYVSSALHLVAKLGVADLLATGPKTADDLARATDTHPASLRRVLRFLVGTGVFVEADDGGFSNAILGELLRTDTATSMRDAVMLFCGIGIREAWLDLEHCVRTGEPAFRKRGAESAFELMEQSPEGGAIFDRAMAAFTRQLAQGVAGIYDFSSARKLLDVGGGNGTLLIEILRAHPHLSGTVLDQPAVAARATTHILESGLSDRLKAAGGDFFDAVPDGADTILIKHVIHDWGDDLARTILRNCRRSMSPDARLLLIEGVYPDRIERSVTVRGATANDVNMLVNTGGRQRSIEEFEDLFDVSGLHIDRIIDTPANVCILEAVATGT